MIDKVLLKKRFEKSLETYDENAIIQNEMALKLIELIKNYSSDFNRIFEFGVGSGNLTQLISNNLTFEKIYLNDIVKKSEFWAKKYVDELEFIQGDIEQIDIPKALDLIISNATIQWIKDFDDLIEKISKSLNKEGIFAFTTFGENNFSEIQKVLGVSLKYFPLKILQEKLAKHFDILHVEENKIELEFENLNEVLKHIKNTGVNCLTVKNFYKSSLINYNLEYTKLFSTQSGVKLTYNPIYIIAKKTSTKGD